MGSTRLLLAGALVLVLSVCACEALLYAKESAFRQVKEINGLWHFRADFSPGRNEGFAQRWYSQPLQKSGDTILMPVPASFNDITQDRALKDYIGWVWYDRQVWLPASWSDGHTRVMLRFESAHYNTIAWVNGHQIANHSGGHLPFEGDITSFFHTDSPNTVTVAVNNTLGPHTLPPGSLSFKGPPDFPENYTVQNLQMDFFNYAGLQRPVKLYTTAVSAHIDDITVTTAIEKDKGNASVSYALEIGGDKSQSAKVVVQLMNRMGNVVAKNLQHRVYATPGCSTKVMGTIPVSNPILWWPWTMSSNPGHLYVLQVTVTADDGMSDEYRQPVGIRTVEVKGMQFLINGEPFYFHGFGKHEDADIRGKGLDYPLIMKDINLILWLGGNSFRTSHYPYAEELMDLCDKYGIVVIDETPAVGLIFPDNFAKKTLDHHIDVLHELVARDKNRPAVVMWSLANEPDSSLPEAEPYFKTLSDTIRQLDPTRPVTFACNQEYDKDRATQFMDVICVNRYFGWYQNYGHPETIQTGLPANLNAWFNTHNKPMILTEYGAGAVAGLHRDPPVMFTEDYQVEILTKTFPVFDELRKRYLIGEMIWNFADFQTAQANSRVDGNKKGVLTRQREPKMAARVLRERYHALSKGKHTCNNDSSFFGFCNV